MVFSSLASEDMFGLVPFKTRPVVAEMFVVLSFWFSLSLSLSLSPFVWYVIGPLLSVFFVFSLSLSLSLSPFLLSLYMKTQTLCGLRFP